VNVPDERLELLAAISQTEKVVPATVEFVDIAGLVKGAAEGQGLGNKFLSNIRECQALVHVVRCFDDTDIIHVDGSVDAARDVSVINFELILADLAQLERASAKLSKNKSKDPNSEAKSKVYSKITEALESGQPARSLQLTADDSSIIAELNLLTLKPCIYAANVSESDLKDQGEKNNHVSDLRKIAANEKADLILVSAQVESEIMQLDEGERKLFLEDLGISKSGLDSLIQATYEQLGLQTYFTTGKKETRAWTVLRGCTAPEAAAVIHSDFERGFIKCETVSFNDFVASNGYAGAKERGLWRLEGKEYIVQEGDVLLFKFNV